MAWGLCQEMAWLFQRLRKRSEALQGWGSPLLPPNKSIPWSDSTAETCRVGDREGRQVVPLAEVRLLDATGQGARRKPEYVELLVPAPLLYAQHFLYFLVSRSGQEEKGLCPA